VTLSILVQNVETVNRVTSDQRTKWEGTRTASHNKDLGNERKATKADNRQREHTTSRQNKRREGGRWGRKHTETHPRHAEDRTGNKAKKHGSQRTEAGQHRKGTNTHLRMRQGERKGLGEGRRGRERERRKEKDGEGERKGVSQAMCPASMGLQVVCFCLVTSCCLVTFSDCRHSYTTAVSQLPQAPSPLKIPRFAEPMLHWKAGSNSMHAKNCKDGTYKSVRLCPFTLLTA